MEARELDRVMGLRWHDATAVLTAPMLIGRSEADAFVAPFGERAREIPDLRD